MAECHAQAPVPAASIWSVLGGGVCVTEGHRQEGSGDHRCRHFRSVLPSRVQGKGVVADGNTGSRESCLVFQIIEITTYLSLHEDNAVERGELMLAGTCRNLCPGWQEHRAVGALVEAWGGWESKPTILDCGGRAACRAPFLWNRKGGQRWRLRGCNWGLEDREPSANGPLGKPERNGLW